MSWLESLLKIVDDLAGSKRALRVVANFAVGLAVVLPFRAWITSFVSEYEVSGLYAFALLVALSLAVGMVAVSTIVFLGEWGWGKWSHRQNLQKAQLQLNRQNETDAENIGRVLPHLHPNQWGPLLLLLDNSEMAFTTANHELGNLESLNLVMSTGHIDRSRTLYRLNPLAEPLIRQHLKREEDAVVAERQKKLRLRLMKASSDEREVLQLYGEAGSTDPNAPPHRRLRDSEYRAARQLSQTGILVRENSSSPERFRIADEAIGLVEELILRKKALRISVGIDLNWVDGSGASGSGATPSR